MERTVVRDSLIAEGNTGYGIDALDGRIGSPIAEVTIDKSVIRGHVVGLLLTGVMVIDRTVIRDNLRRGLNVQASDFVGTASTLELSASVLADNTELALQLPGTNANIVDSVIRDTVVLPAGDGGRGMQISSHDEFLTPSVVNASGLLIERCREAAIVLASSSLTVTASEIRDIRPSSSFGGRGVQMQRASFDPTAPASLAMSSTVLEQLEEVGVMLVGSNATISDSSIRGVVANAQGLLGDGIALVAVDADETSAEIDNCLIENSSRAGMTNFGGTLGLHSVSLVCQAFDLHAETWDGQAATLEDRGGNHCGCPTADGDCVAVSVQLEPPLPL
jgi:hypothetical protein